MQLNEEKNRQVLPMGWSAEEELIIATIQRTEFVPRPEAIRRMQRRKHASRRLAARHLCRNPRCTRGEDRGPGSLAHLRADALYCNATCKKAGQRSLKRKNRSSNSHCFCGSKGDKSDSLLSPPYQRERGAQIVRNRKHNLLDRIEQVGSPGPGLEG
jgi:hypothetical protein